MLAQYIQLASLPSVVKNFQLWEVWLGSASTVSQLASVQSVVKNFQLCQLCDGKASTVSQFTALPFVVKNFQEFQVWLGITASTTVSEFSTSYAVQFFITFLISAIFINI